MEKKNIHKDHRIRVKESYRKTGLDAMPDHNILEILLFYAIPYKDTNPIAHELIDRYQDLNGVLNAPVEDLEKVHGIGEHAATLIKLVHDIIFKYNDNWATQKLDLSVNSQLYDFIKQKFFGEQKEVVYLISLDANQRLKHCIKVSEGSPTSVISDNRSFMELALRYNVDFAILAHNHPQGFATPSRADIYTTEKIAKLFSSVNITLIDHVIVAEDQIFSFAASKRYRICLQ